MHSVGFESTISAGERSQTYALDHAATGTGEINICKGEMWMNFEEQSTPKMRIINKWNRIAEIGQVL